MRHALLFSLCLLCGIFKASADDLRGDTIDVHTYLIRLDLSRVNTDSLWSDATIGIKAKMNGVNAIHLDLLRLDVDSVKVNGNAQAFGYNDSLINIALPVTLNIGDSAYPRNILSWSPDSVNWRFWWFLLDPSFLLQYRRKLSGRPP